ncbi:MAG: thiamine phosphate synthase [Firmicutes bacterium]|nr:thiamine phosphate synthase [Bacillota bacterium]
MKLDKDMLLLYAVTDRAWLGRKTLYEQIEEALAGGVTLVQLREKQLTRPELIAEARALLPLCHSYGAPLIVNDDAEAAVLAGADGVHVGMEDCPVAELRRRFGPDLIIGATAKTVEQARLAEAASADYLGVGAVFPSPTKSAALRITAGQLKEICSSVRIPAVAIGGISGDNIAGLKGCGMAGFALVSAIFGAEDIRRATAALKEQARRYGRINGTIT